MKPLHRTVCGDRRQLAKRADRDGLVVEAEGDLEIIEVRLGLDARASLPTRCLEQHLQRIEQARVVCRRLSTGWLVRGHIRLRFFERSTSGRHTVTPNSKRRQGENRTELRAELHSSSLSHTRPCA